MSTKPLLFLLSTMLVVGVAACNDDGRKSHLDQVVWANDGSEVATIVQRYDESNAVAGAAVVRSNFSHQVYLQKPDGSNKRILSNEMSGQNTDKFYYMHQAGYAVLSYIEKQSDGTDLERYYQLRLAGGQAVGLTTKPDMLVIPSPDGKVMARITQFPSACRPNGSSGTSDACHVEVEFVNPEDLKTIGSKEKVSFASRDRLPAVTWNAAGRLIVTNGAEAFAIKPGEAAQTTAQPGCTSPVTSSGPVDANGVLVYIDGNSVRTRLEPTKLRFGCQG